jgi:ArsR family transcriptional regulator
MDDHLQSQKCARRLKAVADPERLRIIQLLQTGPKNVTELAAELGIEMVNASHHLGVLRNASLVLDEKQGRHVVYSLHPDVFQPKSKAADFLDLGCCRLEIPKAAE